METKHDLEMSAPSIDLGQRVSVTRSLSPGDSTPKYEATVQLGTAKCMYMTLQLALVRLRPKMERNLTASSVSGL